MTTTPIDIRYVVKLPAGVAAAIAFDGLGSELGNGWLDLTRRITLADPDVWLPVSGQAVDLLHDAGRRVFGIGSKVFADARLGDLIRKPTGRSAAPYVYLINGGPAWYPAERLAVVESLTR